MNTEKKEEKSPLEQAPEDKKGHETDFEKKDENKPKKDASITDQETIIKKDASITDQEKKVEENKSETVKPGAQKKQENEDEPKANVAKPSVKKAKKHCNKPSLSLILSIAALSISIIAIAKPSNDPSESKLSYLYSELTQLKANTNKVAEIDHELLRLNIERSMYLLPESERPTLNKMLGFLSGVSTQATTETKPVPEIRTDLKIKPSLTKTSTTSPL